MSSTKKLLSITNLKKYFPVAKTSIFQKQQLYVRANEDISIDIYEGETLGVVGESGCGKSTLGRVLLQLYPQSAGCSLYYGSTIDDLSPSYVKDTIKNADKYRKKYHKALVKAEAMDKRVEEAGGENEADFYLLQSQTIARSELQTAESNMVKILGGFFYHDDARGKELLLQIYEENKKRNKLLSEKKKENVTFEHFEHLIKNDDKAGASAKTKMDKAQAKIKNIDAKIKSIDANISQLKRQLETVKAPYMSDPEFAKYDAMVDNGVDLARLKYKEMRDLRKDMQIIFQDPYSSLNPRFTVGQIIEEGLVTHHFFKHGSAKMREYIVETMEKCGLQEYMLHRYPHQFSGGQRQRICIARALAVQPKFVVCDECVSALDVSIQSQIINLLQELKEKQNLTYMFISHDLSVVKFISDRIMVMYLGNVVELADKDTIFNDPRHPYTVALLSSIPTTDPDSLDKERIILEGNIPSPVNPPAGCKFCTRCFMATDKCKRVAPPLKELSPGHFCACHYPDVKIDENRNFLFEAKTTKGA